MKKGNKQVTIMIIAIFAFIVIIAAALMATLNRQSGMDSNGKYKEGRSIEQLLKKVDYTQTSPRKAQVDLSSSDLADELPDISKYPLSVTGNGQINIEIFSSPEKSGTGADGWLNEMAEEFNQSGADINGASVSVSVRNVSSGLGVDYITSGKYVPDAYTPSNEFWGEMLDANGVSVELHTERLLGNVAGILMKKEVANTLKEKYGTVDIKSIVEATAANELAMGYTNPFSSSTGLNFLMCSLYAYDNNDILSTTAIDGFTKFQSNVPFVSYTTLQMSEAAENGSLDAFVLEYQIYYNSAELKRDYEFIPFGVRHDNPLYAIGNLSAEKKQALDMFVAYCQTENAQKKATKYGFNGMDDYTSDIPDFTGTQLISAQGLYKENKDSGKDIIAVFVADVSGSMDGEPIQQLKQSLINSAQYINENNYIGLVSYSDTVNIELPIAQFDLNQRAYFQGAVEDLTAVGGTASYDAVTVGADMLIKAKEEHPDAKVMLFLLSDGRANTGWDLDSIGYMLQENNIPVYTISYGEDADTDELAALSSVNEASSINADSEDIVYKLKSLFNAQM